MKTNHGHLDSDYQLMVEQILNFVLETEFIDEFDCHTRLGIDKQELKHLIEAIDQRTLFSGELYFLAVSNSLNEICNGLEISPKEWSRWFTYSHDEFCNLFRDVQAFPDKYFSSAGPKY